MLRLKAHAPQLTRQQYQTLKGQILAGDPTGAMKGLRKLLRRNQSDTIATTTTEAISLECGNQTTKSNHRSVV